jgi:hypothetical protein
MANNFHKRHYERVAEAIQEATRVVRAKHDDWNEHGAAVQAIDAVIAELADVFAGDNGQFKRDRFVRACVPGNNVRARS